MCFWDGSLNYILIHFAHIFDECVSLPGWWVMRSRYIFQFFHFFHFVATHVFWWKIYLFALLLLLLLLLFLILLCFSVVSFFLLFSFHFVERIEWVQKKQKKIKQWKIESERERERRREKKPSIEIDCRIQIVCAFFDRYFLNLLHISIWKRDWRHNDNIE